MTNVVFDLSNLFFRSLFIVGGYGAKSYSFDSQFEVDQLMRKVATDISYIIRQINPSRVIFALDSKSWRKEISIDENEGYKGNREMSGMINWDNVYNTMKEFGEILDSNGFIVSKIERAEADDLIALWTNELLFKHNQHVVIVSADEDVRQLAYEVNKKIFSTVYNPFSTGKNASKKLYVPKYFNEWLDTLDVGDIFNRAIDIDKEDFKRLKNNENTLIEEIDGNTIAMKKILCGDDGDNVPSIYTWMSKTAKGDDKVVRITNSKFEKIVELIGAKDYHDLVEHSDIIYDQLKEISGTTPPFKIEDRLKRQIKLVVLSPSEFPEDIVKQFNDETEKHLKKQNIHPQNCNMNSILEGTRYIKSKNSGSEMSIFKEVDRLNKELF